MRPDTFCEPTLVGGRIRCARSSPRLRLVSNSSIPNRNTATPAELLDFAKAVGIPDVDLPTTLPEQWRRVSLSGGYNFRDSGGYPGLDGRTVKTGMIWRSDHMNDLTDDDLEVIEGLDIKVVQDFRIDLEVERQPSRLPGNNTPQVIRLVMGDVTGSESAIQIIADVMAGTHPVPPADFWDHNYLDMLDRGRHMFVGLFDSLANRSSLPSLYHCTGGKDRTGIATVLLHAVLGVDRDVSVNDFLFTNLYRTPFRAAGLASTFKANGVDPVAMLPILGVCRSAINAALHAIDTTYGGPERYLIDGGLAPGSLDDLRAHLLA